MAVADISECTKRFNRLIFTTDSYVVPLSNPPKRRSFNSDQEILDIILEADEAICLIIRNTIGHPYAPLWFTLSSALVNGDKIPSSDAPIHNVTWATTSNGTYINSEVADEADINEAVKAIAAIDFNMFGTAADTYGYHNIVGSLLKTTSPFNKVTQAPWTRTSVCQSPQSYTTAIIMLAITLAPKEGLNNDLIQFATGKWQEFVPLITSGQMILPEVVQYGFQEAAP